MQMKRYLHGELKGQMHLVPDTHSHHAEQRMMQYYTAELVQLARIHSLCRTCLCLRPWSCFGLHMRVLFSINVNA